MVIDDLKSKLVEFQKSKDAEKLGVLRYYLSKVQNKEIDLRPKGEKMTDEVAFKLLRKLVKDRLEGIEMYKNAGREESVKKEERELEILREFAKMFPFELDL